MNDIGSQLREAMTAAVADAEPPRSVMELVRLRYRRRNRRTAAACALGLACLLVAVPLVGARLNGAGRGREPASGTPLFPGGGRLLISTGSGPLEWLYPDGRTVPIAYGFAGAIPEGNGLLAWKQTRFGDSYYTMNLNGSDPRLVLPAGHSRQLSTIAAQLSPDGAMLAYDVQDIVSASKVTDELWSVDLATGHRRDLGPGSGIVWKNSSTILADSADQRALELINVRNGSRRTYLTVSDPRLIRAYERARPGAGPPNSISADGWGRGASPVTLAVSLTTVSSSQPAGEKPAEILVEPGRILAFAPDRNSLLSLTWGVDGIFLLHSGNGDNPVGWHSYLGTVRSERLISPPTFGEPWDGAAFSPQGNEIALGYSGNGIIGVVPVPAPACLAVGRCSRVQPTPPLDRGTLLAWAAQ